MRRKKLNYYPEKLEDANLMRFLVDADHFVHLKELLDKESAKLEKIQKLYRKKALDFGSVMVFEDLRDAMAQIKQEADSFLGLKQIPLPKIVPYHILNFSASYIPVLFGFIGIAAMAAGLLLWRRQDIWFVFIFVAAAVFLGYRIMAAAAAYSSRIASSYSYSPLTQTVIVPPESGSYGRRAELVYVLAHEYAHHVQNACGLGGLFSGKRIIFKEGFAIGIQRHVAQIYALKENNEAFLYGILDEEVAALQGVYVWLSRELEMPFSRRSIWLKTSRRPFESTTVLKSSSKAPSAYALGCVLFLLLENKYGVKIYSDILRGEFGEWGGKHAKRNN